MLCDLPSFLPLMGTSSLGQVPVGILKHDKKKKVLKGWMKNISHYFTRLCLLLMILVGCFPALLCSRFIFFFRLRKLCKYEASWAESSFWTCFSDPCISCLLGQSWKKEKGQQNFMCRLVFHKNFFEADVIHRQYHKIYVAVCQIQNFN